MVSQRRITQIIPAEGWLAVYDMGTGDVSDIRTRPLICWALMADSCAGGELSGTNVVGLDADHAAGNTPADSGTFLGYVRVGESLARFRKD